LIELRTREEVLLQSPQAALRFAQFPTAG